MNSLINLKEFLEANRCGIVSKLNESDPRVIRASKPVPCLASGYLLTPIGCLMLGDLNKSWRSLSSLEMRKNLLRNLLLLPLESFECYCRGVNYVVQTCLRVTFENCDESSLVFGISTRRLLDKFLMSFITHILFNVFNIFTLVTVIWQMLATSTNLNSIKFFPVVPRKHGKISDWQRFCQARLENLQECRT